MAERGRYTPVEILKRIAVLARLRRPQAEIARECGVSRNTVRKYTPADVEPNPPGRPAQFVGSLGGCPDAALAPPWQCP